MKNPWMWAAIVLLALVFGIIRFDGNGLVLDFNGRAPSGVFAGTVPASSTTFSMPPGHHCDQPRARQDVPRDATNVAWNENTCSFSYDL